MWINSKLNIKWYKCVYQSHIAERTRQGKGFFSFTFSLKDNKSEKSFYNEPIDNRHPSCFIRDHYMSNKISNFV